MANKLRKFNMKRSGLKICFFGPSGSGKSTCFEMAKDAIVKRVNRGVTVYRADVATPLHEIQWNAYMKLGLVNPSQDRFEDMRQDGKLLSFLANHFEYQLGRACYAFVDILSQAHPHDAVFVNTDCRNNAYDSLHDLGFWFVRIATDEEVARERLVARHDLTPHKAGAATEQIDKITAHWTLENNGTLDELREQMGCVVQAAIFKREEFLSA